MNMLSRDELAQSRDAYEEGAEVRNLASTSTAPTLTHSAERGRGFSLPTLSPPEQ